MAADFDPGARFLLSIGAYFVTEPAGVEQTLVGRDGSAA
jgi:hypothetical protein